MSMVPPLRFAIVGGVAAGASAAARARRLSENAQIVLIERGAEVSFANCGLPYYIGGEITDRSRLALQTPQSLASLLHIDVRPLTEALAIDTLAKIVRVRHIQTGEQSDISYDKLLLAPGATPLRPPLPGIDLPNVLTLRNLQDMDRIKEHAARASSILIAGAGFIGLEMAEQFIRLGKKTTVVELMDQVLPQMDSEMTQWIVGALRENGVHLVLGDGIQAFEQDGQRVRALLASGARHTADFVLLSIGVKPENKLAADAELALGQRGAIVVNEFQQTSNPDIYAAGDAVETADRVLEGRAVVPLGTPANRQGRLVADHIFMPEKARPYPGTQGTAIVRVFDTVAGVTGWTEKRLRSHGIEFDSAIVTDFNHAGYYPGATPVTLKILWRKNDGRLLGAQAAGADGIDKRLDVLSTAIAGALSAEDLADLELAYAPPFGSVRDVVNTAGFCARNIRDQLADFVAKPPKDSQFLDVRPPEITALDPVKGALTIPFGQLRKRLNEIDKAKPVVAVCALGKTSYFASRMLLQNGFDAMSLSGGLRVFAGSKVLPEHTRPISLAPSSSLIDSIPDATIDATGLACPGPLLKVREAIDRLPHGQCLEVRASDPGFAHDITAFCGAAGYPEPAIRKDKGIVIARIFKNPGERQFQPNRTQTTNLDTTLVVFSQEMDKALAALVIANGAAAMGGKVTLFFTFWGLNVLRRDAVRNAPQKGWMDRMFDFMLPRGPRKLPLSNMDFLGMGRAMMKWRMKSKGLPSVEGLLAQARRMGVRLVACSMSMDAMGIQLSELVDGVEVGGVADFMAASAQSGTNLFI